jgi:hypothetical protein
MNLAESIYQHSLNLPEPAAREVLDFIEFLEQKEAKKKSHTKAHDDTAQFLAALSGGLSEDFPDDIDDSDLGEDTPREALD